MRIRTPLSIATVIAISCATATVTAGSATANEQHGLGYNPSATPAFAAPGVQPDESALAPFPQFSAVPASVDLSQYALPPGDQGSVGSCVAWATGYSAYGILMNEQGISGAPMAPMYIYSQIAKGVDTGTNASVALPMEQNQGIDTKADYWQGDFDYTTQPDDAERANAANYKLSGYEALPLGADAQAAIESAISQGMPVVIGFMVHQSFMNLDAQTASSYTYLPGDSSSDPIDGGHEVAIVGYNDQGVRIENSWGSGWGDGGFVTVPWSFFTTGDVDEIHSVGKLLQS